MLSGTDRKFANWYKHSPLHRGGHRPTVCDFDIFKIDPIGNVLWRGSAENFVAAQTRVATLFVMVPGEYLIFNQKTRQRVVVDLAAAQPQLGESPWMAREPHISLFL